MAKKNIEEPRYILVSQSQSFIPGLTTSRLLMISAGGKKKKTPLND